MFVQMQRNGGSGNQNNMRCPETRSTDIQIIEICKLRKKIVLHANSGRWKYGREPCCSHRHIRLNVYQKNARAISFYQREGFIIQCEDLDEATGEKEYTMLWKQK